MHRCYLAQADWSSPTLCIEGEEAKHALKVMRLRQGDLIELFDGQGQAACCKIINSQGSSILHLEVQELLPTPAPLPQLSLALSIPKGGNMELVVQKGVELGVSRIIPLLSERTVVRVKSAQEAEQKRLKWERTVLEACKQCGVNLLPEVAAPQTLKDFLASKDWEHSFPFVCALLPQSKALRELLEPIRKEGRRAATLLVGPEGDFSPKEYEQILTAGFHAASLGPIILRVETAVFMAISACRYAFES